MFAVGTGCYQYQSGSIATIRPSEIVHVALSPEASVSLASTIGPNATTIDGRVLSVNQTTLRLAVTQIARAVGPEEFLQNEPIEIPARGALEITVRSVDRMRSALAFGGLLAGVLAGRAITDQAGIVSVKGASSSTGAK